VATDSVATPTTVISMFAVVARVAKGEATGTVARMFGLSAGRVSQLRQELRRSCEAFQGEPNAG
jgi:hypothetical protein